MASTCPDADLLRGFLLGRIHPDEVELLAGHVEGCAACIERLQAIRDDDAVVDVMRSRQPGGVESTATQLGELVTRICELRSLAVGVRPAASGLLAQVVADLAWDVHSFLEPPREGDEIGRLGAYRVLKVLGSGGMGVVFQAHDPMLQRHVALKVMKPRFLDDPGARERFLREARAAASLAHDHIMPILHIGEERGVPFLFMPLLEGETLEERLKRQPRLPVADVLRLGSEIAEGLAAAHARGLIHRDIKPANIFLSVSRSSVEVHGDEKPPPATDETPATAGERVQILDFGLARAVAGDPGLTQSGTILGTPSYMAPEQARGEVLDVRSDLFSLGCVLYRMTTGDVPFQGVNTLATLRALEMTTPKPPHSVRPEVPRPLSELIVRLLAKRSADRPPSARAVVQALAEIRAGKASQASVARLLRLRIGVVLAGVAVVVGLTLALSLWRGSPDGSSGERHDSARRFRPSHFAPPVNYDVGIKPYGVAVGDFNGDGHLDLAVTNFDSNAVSVLLGKGDGTLAPAVDYAVGKMPRNVVVGDFNRDSKLDLAVTDTKSDTISILHGIGDGTFQLAGNLATSTGPAGLAVSDFNGDGILDLVSSDGPGHQLSVFLGKDDGAFRPAIRVPCPGAANALAVADCNGDGHMDLVVNASGGNYVSVFLGRGDGTFQPPKNYSVGSGPGALVFADFNGDGHPDIAVENFGNNDVSVLLGNGDGTFQTAVNYSAGWGPGGLAVGDVNGDGVSDLIVGNHGSHNVSVLLGKGDGTFRPAESFAAGWTPASVAIADLNRDGHNDLIVVNHNSNNISLLLGRPPGPRFRLSALFEGRAGDASIISIAALEATHQPDHRFSGRIRLNSSDRQMAFSDPSEKVVGGNGGEFEFKPGDNGLLPLRLRFDAAGAQTLIITDSQDSTRQGAVTILVEPGAAKQLRIETPAECEAGRPFTVKVSALDPFDNVATSHRGTVRLNSTDAAATLPRDHAFAENDQGMHTFSVTLATVGRQTLTATDTGSAAFKASKAITVQPAR